MHAHALVNPTSPVSRPVVQLPLPASVPLSRRCDSHHLNAVGGCSPRQSRRVLDVDPNRRRPDRLACVCRYKPRERRGFCSCSKGWLKPFELLTRETRSTPSNVSPALVADITSVRTIAPHRQRLF